MLSPRYHQHFYRNQKLLEFRNTRINCKIDKFVELFTHKWKVTFNANKSKDIIFSNRYLNNSPPLIFNDTCIERVNSHKHLGLVLTSNLDWGPQINSVCMKANQKLSVLRSIKLLNRKTLDLLYKITVRSVIDYEKY